ncbi:cupin 2 domain-containing protein [Gammaproteobacteria bacterium]
MSTHNLFSDLNPAPLEQVDALLTRPDVRIERIVFWGQVSPPGFWYDQAEAEWVVVLHGQARLVLKEPDVILEMMPGDWIWIAARRPHRVDWTVPDEATVWLAVFSAAEFRSP